MVLFKEATREERGGSQCHMQLKSKRRPLDLTLGYIIEETGKYTGWGGLPNGSGASQLTCVPHKWASARRENEARRVLIWSISAVTWEQGEEPTSSQLVLSNLPAKQTGELLCAKPWESAFM